MKKYFIIVSVVLLVLNMSPFALHKDRVDYSLNIRYLSPRHWTLIDYTTPYSGNINSSNFSFQSEKDITITPEPLTKGAESLGFPFSFYFSQNTEAGFKIKAWSWVWTSVDSILALLPLSYVLSSRMLRKPKDVSKPEELLHQENVR